MATEEWSYTLERQPRAPEGARWELLLRTTEPEWAVRLGEREVVVGEPYRYRVIQHGPTRRHQGSAIWEWRPES